MKWKKFFNPSQQTYTGTSQQEDHISGSLMNSVQGNRKLCSRSPFNTIHKTTTPPSLLDSALRLLVQSAQAPYYPTLPSEPVQVGIQSRNINTETIFCIN